MERNLNCSPEKKVAQDVAQDLAQDVAQDMSGAAEDGGVKAFILPIAIFQRWNPRPTYACRPPRCPWATRGGKHVKDVAQDLAKGLRRT